MKKLFLVPVLILSCLVLTGCTSDEEVKQIKEQNDLLKQKIELQDQKIEDAKQLQADRVKENENFEKNLKCQERGDKLKATVSNYNSIYYNEIYNTCYVRIYNSEKNIMEEGDINTFGVASNTPLSSDELLERDALYGNQTIKWGVNLRTAANANASLIQKIDPTNIVTITSHKVVDGQLRYEIDFDGKHGWISHLAFSD